GGGGTIRRAEAHRRPLGCCCRQPRTRRISARARGSADRRRPVRRSLGADAFAYDDPPSLSTGARSGRWLELGPPWPAAANRRAGGSGRLGLVVPTNVIVRGRSCRTGGIVKPSIRRSPALVPPRPPA